MNQGKSAMRGSILEQLTVKKKAPNGKGTVNGMLVALHPSGTIHVGGSKNMGAINDQFKMTMKHNSSNHSIQSTKKVMAPIKKPTEVLAGYANGQSVGPSALLGQNN